MVVSSFLFDGSVFFWNTENISLGKKRGDMCAIKLSSQNSATVDDNVKSWIIHPQFRNHFGQDNRSIGQK